ncbi:MAG: hypothetical protein ACRED8_02855 [Caulobacteraceae bacterium]
MPRNLSGAFSRGLLIALGVGAAALFGATIAHSQPSPVTEVPQAAPVAPSPVESGQIAPSAPDAAAAPAQVSPPDRGVAARPLPPSARGARAVYLPPVHGADRCDPAHRSRNEAACRRLLENRTEEFAHPRASETIAAPKPDASASDLVNDILHGGTGEVVGLPH